MNTLAQRTNNFAYGFAGFVLCLLTLLVAWSLSHRTNDQPLPMSNEEIIQAAEHCERNGLGIWFDYYINGKPTGYHCGGPKR